MIKKKILTAVAFTSLLAVGAGVGVTATMEGTEVLAADKNVVNNTILATVGDTQLDTGSLTQISFDAQNFIMESGNIQQIKSIKMLNDKQQEVSFVAYPAYSVDGTAENIQYKRGIESTGTLTFEGTDRPCRINTVSEKFEFKYAEITYECNSATEFYNQYKEDLVVKVNGVDAKERVSNVRIGSVGNDVYTFDITLNKDEKISVIADGQQTTIEEKKLDTEFTAPNCTANYTFYVNEEFQLWHSLVCKHDVVYFKPNDNWLQSTPRFAVNLFVNGSDPIETEWIELSEVSAGLYSFNFAQVNEKYTHMIFVRINPDPKLQIGWEAKWNQTSDIDIANIRHSTNNTCSLGVNGWDKAELILDWSYTEAID